MTTSIFDNMKYDMKLSDAGKRVIFEGDVSK